jgi:hypothetical protein
MNMQKETNTSQPEQTNDQIRGDLGAYVLAHDTVSSVPQPQRLLWLRNRLATALVAVEIRQPGGMSAGNLIEDTKNAASLGADMLKGNEAPEVTPAIPEQQDPIVRQV